MIVYTPKRRNKAAVIISLLLFICTAAALCFGVLGIGNRLVLQIIGTISLTAGIFITGRYSLCEFKYVLNPTNTEFSIIKKQGGKSKTMCNISLETGIAIVPKLKVSELEKIYGTIKRRFNYCVNIFPIDSYYYVFKFNDGTHVIEFEPDEDFVNAFIKYIKLRLLEV